MDSAGQLRENLASLTLPADAPPILGRIVAWARVCIGGLLTYIDSALGLDEEGVSEIDRAVEKIDDLAACVDDIGKLLKIEVAERADAERAAAAKSARPSHPKAPPRNNNIRCNRCHARGHIQSDCKSTNPEVVRKRVAKNKRAAANAAPTLLRLAAPSAPTLQSLSATTPFDPHIIALAADAAELRRRTVQSSRDKKRSRAPKAPASTSQ
jgi:hypothetical protein